VDLYEQIRRQFEFGAGTILGIARKLGCSPADGARSSADCDTGADEEGTTSAGEDGQCGRIHRCDSGERPQSTAIQRSGSGSGCAPKPRWRFPEPRSNGHITKGVGEVSIR
jgi:hypothetical protein